ncbi:hypothetical protein EW146_g4682 [Bondarzewia mesenterica]|uniref:Myb-like domain-containing protein n=1 Tax=Bondarzewia mesenterica TaxID=1095465 RepID=A0A4S4LTT3_9AGAM|nr:hypothetical protein EW146_g4682 [Bondarzewia mesenterica]
MGARRTSPGPRCASLRVAGVRTADDLPQPPVEKKARKKWTEEETRMLVEGCNRHGVGNWKAILHDSSLRFDHRSPVDLKDRFRTYFPDAYKQHYPNAKTHLSSKVRSALPDGSSIFEKTRSKKRRPFTEDEDRALKAGYDKHGTVWATIVKDPIFQEQNRRSTDLRDRFRNAFPDLYQAAGYKPRNSSKKKKDGSAVGQVRAATDEQLTSIRDTGPARRKRRHTTQGFLRGGTKSVPQSTTCSENEDSSADEEVDEYSPPNMSPPDVKDGILSPTMGEAVEEMPAPTPVDLLNEFNMQTIDPMNDSLAMPDFLHSSSQSLSELTDSSQSQSWSNTPMHSTATWSSANTAASPTSSQDLLFDSPFSRRGMSNMNVIGKSAWGPSDWLAGNPRLDPSASSSSSSYFGGVSPSPSSPFSLTNLSHGVLDRYDLFPHSFAHDFASEAGAGDTHSTFSDPEMFSSSAFRGFTHHSNYAGDLIFGARTHQPQASDYGLGFGFGSAGLGLSDMQQPAGLHPMQLHTPALPGIDELELTAITLHDGDSVGAEDAMDTSGTLDIDVNVNLEDKSTLPLEGFPSVGLPQQTLDEIIGLSTHSHELIDTPPGTPVRATRTRPSVSTLSQIHNRSLSVPPPEHRFPYTLASAHSYSQSPAPHSLSHSHAHAPLTPTRSLSLDLNACADAAVGTNSDSALHALLQGTDPFSGAGGIGGSPGDLNDLPFLDLHYYGSPAGTDGASQAEEMRQGLALDLAAPQMQPCASGSSAAGGGKQQAFGMATGISPFAPHVHRSPIAVGAGVGTVTAKTHMHQRGQSAVSPQDLVLRTGSGDNKRKRASWDGGPR